MVTSPERLIPGPKINNVWYSHTDSDTILIFLHGIFSDSRGCWMYREPKKRSRLMFFRRSNGIRKEIFWPDLVAQDRNFAGVDIFLAGFHTEIDSLDYDLAQCAHEVFGKLMIPLLPADKPVMAKKNLIFVGHSTGGIIARYLLERNQKAFQQKNVGVVLIASPSTGSVYADLFEFLARVYKNELGGVLRRDSTLLKDLDGRFREMVQAKEEHIPHLMGAEACEHHMILRKKLWGKFGRFVPAMTTRIVDPVSAGQYFPPTKMIAESDHFSVVKPPSLSHDTHGFLYGFWYRFQTQFLQVANAQVQQPPALAPAAPLESIIGRGDLMNRIKHKLLNGESCALYGPADIGKTFIAHNLVHDKELRAAFPDGVLWGVISPEKDVGALLANWSEALGIPTASIAQLKRVDDRARAVANEVDQRRMLIVCDNCETEETALLVRFIGPKCGRLLTTRLDDVAQTFGGKEGSIQVDSLTAEDSRQLFTQIAVALKDDSETTSKIISVLGGNPGEISVIGRMLAGIKNRQKRDEIIRRLLERDS